MTELMLRPIQPHDNNVLASIIRDSIDELSLPHDGTAYSDPTTDDLFSLFNTPGSFYYTLLVDGIVMGGCGIFPTIGLPANCAELVRFFLRPEARGKKWGHLLMNICIDKALELGYTSLYLESFPDMQSAMHLYKRYGFETLQRPLGQTGHHSCNVWMLKNMKESKVV